MQRYFLTDLADQQTEIELPAEITHHLVTVLRAEVGTQFELVLANEQVYLAHLVKIDNQLATAVIDEQLAVSVELPINVVVASGLPKGDKPELVTQKATELGAKKIIFFDSERSIAKWAPAKQSRKLERLQKIAAGAAEQAHRQAIPEVSFYNSLNALLENEVAQVKVVAWEESAKVGERSGLSQALDVVKPGATLLTIFGSEGGLSEQEVEQMTEYEVKPVGLGPRILRTETAPLYMLAAVSYHFELEN